MKKTDESARDLEKSKSRSSRRNERRYKGRRNRLNQDRSDDPECPICNRSIRDISAAITDVDTDRPAHFDCILKKLSENENIGQQEKIIYLGSGGFGIVKFTNNRKFEIIKKINYENIEEKNEWRKEKRFKFPDK